MRVLNVAGRLNMQVEGGAVDVETASKGRFGSSPQAIFDRWDELRSWAGALSASDARELRKEVRETDLLSPVPRPPTVFAIGLNYRDHAEEAGLALPERPMVFTKFPASVTGPTGEIALPRGSVDFEAELVAVIGRRAEHVDVGSGWDHVAGLTVGQDLSERELQMSGPPPQQFNLGKSFAGFAPMGPLLVTPDELANPDDLEIGCSLGGATMQKSRTSEMVYSVPEIVAYLSSVLPLLPGDVIFTGTPAGIGWARKPRRMIGVGDELVTTIEGIGSMRHRFVESKHESPMDRSWLPRAAGTRGTKNEKKG